MGGKRVASWVLGFIVAGAVLALVIGAILGQPILLGFVETGSMEPTIGAGDGFFAVPTELAGDLGPGDVVVYENSDGELTTHRIVGETDRGYITQGDNNLVTDQDGGEPPVQRAQIVAVAWGMGNDPIVIPFLGTAVTGIQSIVLGVQSTVAGVLGVQALLGAEGLLLLIFILTMVFLAFDVVLTRGRRVRPGRDRSRNDAIPVRTLLIVFAVVVMLAATGAMVVPADNHEFGIVSAEFDSDRADVIQQGTTDEITMPVVNDPSFIPVHTYFEAGSPEVTMQDTYAYVPAGEERNVSFTVDAPPETGFFPMYVREYRYLAILPVDLTDILYDTHPWAPIIVINLILGGSVYLGGRLLVGDPKARIRTRPRRAHRSVLGRIKRRIPLL